LIVFHITYNARHLRPEDVAKTFVFNPDFEELLQDNHTVLLGARGCGKTTLMKMLTLPAMYAWENENAEKIRTNLGFYTVYISTDIYWNAQKDSYNSQLSKFPKYVRKSI
jgi:ATPase subunit of ABC transporter with duplicated ATPase domains